MTKVIVDTSSLVRFIDFSYRFDYSKWEEASDLSKCMSLSIPAIGGVGMNVDIPYSMGNEVTSKLLTFIHKMLLNK